jgi:outer membrane cobalamin receptor
VQNAGYALDETESDSLADLIYMGVSVASKKAEKITEAPGIVSVITAEDIQNMAHETLYDVITTIPGVTVTESYFGYTSVSFRGIKESHYNNRTLLLLNGHAVRDVTVGTHWFEAIPANVIEKIEIIRGPGSVMYGNGAFAGVINVITKAKVDLVNVSLTTGMKNLVDVYATYAKKMDGLNFILGCSYLGSSGYGANAKDETGTEAKVGSYEKDKDAYENDYYNVFGNISVGQFELDLYHFNQEKDKFGLVPVHAMTGEATSTSSGVALRMTESFAALELNSILYYDRSAYLGFLESFAGTEIEMRYSGRKYGLDISGIYSITEQLDISLGTSFEYQQSDPYEFYDLIAKETHWASAFLREYTTADNSVYAQVEVLLLEDLKLLGGLRFNSNTEYGGTYVPRMSIVYSLGEEAALKLLYGAAYRNPTFFEKYVNARNVLYGDPDLNPERIDTLELSADWMLAAQKFRVTVFGLVTDDMISRSVVYASGDIPAVADLENRNVSTLPSATTPGYGNTQGQRIYGLEFEVQGDVVKELLSYTFNCAYKEGKEKTDWSPIQFLDQIVFNVKLVNRMSAFTNTLTLGCVGERKGNIASNGSSPEFAPGQEVSLPAQTLLDLRVAYAVTTSLEISAEVENILGQDVLYPEYIRRRIDAIPGDSGTNVFGQVKYSF